MAEWWTGVKLGARWAFNRDALSALPIIVVGALFGALAGGVRTGEWTVTLLWNALGATMVAFGIVMLVTIWARAEWKKL